MVALEAFNFWKASMLAYRRRETEFQFRADISVTDFFHFKELDVMSLVPGKGEWEQYI